MSTIPETRPVCVDGAPIQYERCPEIAREILRRYIEHGIHPGSGYSAILRNELRAVIMVDADTLRELPNILRWLHNYAPANSHGSRERFERWMLFGRGAANA